MNFELLSFLQRRVLAEAKKKLQNKPWYSGICMDNFPSDEIIKADFHHAVRQVMLNTAYWDAPSAVTLLEL